MTFRSAALGLLYLWMMIAASPVARGQILNWQTGQVIPGTEGITPGPGADLRYWSSEAYNLRYADLTDAVVAGAFFRSTTGRGFTKEQLYSTASYKNRDLTGIQLGYNDLTGWNLAGQNLTNVWFDSATLTDTDLSFADLRGGYIFQGRAAAILRNAIMPDGAIDTLNMETSEQLTVRDYEKPTIWDHDIPLTVRSGMTLADGSVLEMIFADETWGSTMVLAGGFTPDLGGVLR